MKKKKLLLLYPGDFYSKTWGRRIQLKPHMVYIYTFLKDWFDVSVLDLENEFQRPEDENSLVMFKKKALERMLSIETDYLAISCWSSLNYLSSLFFARAIKQKKPKVKIIVGGYHPTFVPDDFIFENSPFDHVVQGEIHQIIDIIGENIVSVKHTHDIVPDYANYPYFDGQKTIGLFLSSGCPFHCRFCMEYKKKWSCLPVKKAIDYVCHLHKTLSPKYIPLFDACFGLDKEWRREFFTSLIKQNLDIYFWIETRADLLDEKDIELISQLKIKMDFGIDSFSTTMLGIMGKTQNPESFLDHFINISRTCSSLGVLHDTFMIFNHPGETRQTYEEFLKFFDKRIKPELIGGYLRIKYQRFSYYPGSYIYNHRAEFEKKYGFSVRYPLWWKEHGDHYQLSRNIIPSLDEKEKPFFVPLKETALRIKAFNQKSKHLALWEKLHAFDL